MLLLLLLLLQHEFRVVAVRPFRPTQKKPSQTTPWKRPLRSYPLFHPFPLYLRFFPKHQSMVMVNTDTSLAKRMQSLVNYEQSNAWSRVNYFG
uniref:Putative secreted protein n=1 Tax=Anopheles triannulatus TaxID=58253 RepID=A0A2M4B4B7_9DIPT